MAASPVIQTLIRGCRFDRTDGEIQEILEDETLSDAEKEEIIDSISTCNYSGVDFSVTFDVSKEICLLGLGFHGPYHKESADYKVKINVLAMNSRRDPLPNYRAGNYKVLAKLERMVESARRQEIVDVDFPMPIQLPAHTWIRIEFRLDGPNTCISNPESAKTIVTEIFEGTKDEDVRFFFLCSSNQMPLIKYSRLQN